MKPWEKYAKPSGPWTKYQNNDVPRGTDDRSLLKKNWDVAMGAIEPAATMATAFPAQILGGAIGLASAPFVGLERAGDVSESVEDYLTYKPQTEGGRAGLEAVGQNPVIKAIGTGLEKSGEFLEDATYGLTGSDALATGMRGVPEAAIAVTGAGGVGKLRPKTLPKAKGTTENVRLAQEFAQSEGKPLMTTDVRQPQTFMGKSAQSMAEKIPLAGTGGPRAAQQAERASTVQEYVQKFGDYNPSDVYDSLSRNVSKLKQAAGKRRGAIAEQVSQFTPFESRAVRAIDAEIERLSKTAGKGAERATTDTQTITQLQKYRDDLVNDPSFASLDDLRTSFRENVKGERQVLPNRSQAAIERIYGAMTEDMDSVVKGALGPEQLSKWKQANAIYANEAKRVKNTRLKNVLQKGEQTPEDVNKLLYSMKPSEVKNLYSSLTAKGREAARSGLIQKAWETANESPDRFLNNLKKFSKNTEIFFRGEDAKYLDGMKAWLDQTRRAAQAGVNPPTGQAMVPYTIGAGIGADLVSTGGALTATAGGAGLMARLYESAPVRRAMIRIANTPKGSSGFTDAVLAANGIILMDVIGRQQAQDKSQDQTE